MKNKSRKGVTLLELTIVMALLAIVSAMVISFSALVRNNVLAITTENVVLADFSKIEKTYDSWISTFDEENYEFYVEGENTLIARNKVTPSKTYKLFMNEEGLLVGSVPLNSSGQSKVIYDGTGTINSISFVIHENDETKKLLIELSVEYTSYNVAGTKLVKDSAHFLRATRAATLYSGE